MGRVRRPSTRCMACSQSAFTGGCKMMGTTYPGHLLGDVDSWPQGLRACTKAPICVVHGYVAHNKNLGLWAILCCLVLFWYIAYTRRENREACHDVSAPPKPKHMCSIQGTMVEYEYMEHTSWCVVL